MKNSLFNSENWLWTPFGLVADFLLLSCLWLLCSIPVLTVGAASAAMYDCCARCVKDGERALFSRFFRTFRRELPKSIPSVLLWAVILGGLFFLARSFTGSAAGTDVNLVLAYSMAVFLAVVAGIASWVFPLLSRFTFDFASLNLTAIRLALAHLLRTVALGAVNIAAGWLCLRFLMPVMVVPGIAALLSAYILEPVFKPYETGDAGEDTCSNHSITIH